MSEITFKPAVRENVGLLISIAGGTGSGKTMSAMRLASGIVGTGNKFAVIDTEARRALHYADQFKFDHADLHPPFRPDTYADAIQAADKAGYKAIVVDSGSHVWNGDGGVLDWAEEELDRMAGDDWKKRDSCKMASWIRPKCSHKQMVQRLLQVRAHLILCLRAEEKIEMKRNDQGKMEIISKEGPTGLHGWFPVCEKNLPYEMTASFLLLATRPGIPNPIKLEAQHRALFPLDQPITEESGRLIARWAAGETIGAQTQPPSQPPTTGKAAPNPEGIALKRKLWATCAPVHGCALDAKGTEQQVSKFEIFLIENCGVGDSEEVKTMTNDRLREIVAKAETEVAKLPT